MNNKKHIIVLFYLCVVLLLLPQCSFLDPFNTQFDEVEDAILYSARTITPPGDPAGSLKIMTWNIKYCGGRFFFFWEMNGDTYNMTAEEVMEALGGITALINSQDPDILILQEVDRESKRSAYIDQCQYILDHTALNYGAYAAIWKGDIVPTDGIQRVDTGNLILCKWPLKNAKRYALPSLPDQDMITDYFYFHRNLLVAEPEIPGQDAVYILNIHTEPFDEGPKDDTHTKKRHIDAFKEKMDELAAGGGIVAGGGDFNALPDGSDEVDGFPDAQGEYAEKASYVGEETWMIPLMTEYNCAVPLSEYAGADSPLHFTFPATYSGNPGGGGWNRVLDYIFSTNSLTPGIVLQDETYNNLLSDHAPIITEMGI